MRAPRSNRSRAFTLIEVTLALGITAFCLIPLLGMLPIGLKNDANAAEQTSANAILTAVAADLRGASRTPTGGGTATTQQFGIPIPADPAAAGGTPTILYFTGGGIPSNHLVSATESSSTTGSVGNYSRYLVTIQFSKNTPNPTPTPSPAPVPAPANVAATFATVLVSWPAVVPAARAAGKVQTFVAMNRN